MGLVRQNHRATSGSPSRWVSRTSIKPSGSILFEQPETLPDKLHEVVARGFRAIKLGWGPFGRVSSALDETLVRVARESVGSDIELMVDAGASEAYWQHGYKWAVETARMLADYDIVWFEEALPPDDLDGYVKLRENAPIPIASGEVLTRRQSFIPWAERGVVDIISLIRPRSVGFLKRGMADGIRP